MAKSKQAEEITIKAIKGFNADLRCYGDFQYEIGKTYEHKGSVAVCDGGFHACDGSPFDVWNYFGPVGDDGRLNRFADVILAGPTSRKTGDGEDSKLAAGKITIEAEIRLPDFIRRAVSWVIDHTKGKGDDPSGHSAQIGSSGDSAQIGSSGDSAKIGSSGDSAKIGSSGDSAKIGSSGDSAKIGSSGHSAKIGSSGDSAKIGSSGDSAQIGSSGDSAKIGSSGDYAQIGSSGDSAKIGSSGDYAQIVAEGANSVVASAGYATVSGADGTWISIAEFKNSKCVGFATGCIGQDGLEAGVAYIAKGGKLVPAT